MDQKGEAREGPATTCILTSPADYLLRAVLVGDPQQLPATVKSQRGKELQLERSLFERLQRGGCPVKVLSVQYRMHPEIRMFPSNHFYGGRLEDGWVIHSENADIRHTC